MNISRIFTFLCLLTSVAFAAEVSSIQKPTFEAEITGVKDSSLVFSNGEEIPMGDLISIRFPKDPLHLPRPEAAFILANGDVLYGSLKSVKGETLTIETPVAGERSWKVDRFRGVVLQPTTDSGKEQIRQMSAENAQRGPQDVVYLDYGDHAPLILDLPTVQKEKIVGMMNGNPIEFEKKNVLAVEFAELAPYEPMKGTAATISLRDGGRLTGTLLSAASDSLKLNLAIDGAAVELPRKYVKEVRFRGGNYVFLSELEPNEVEERPFFYDPSVSKEKQVFWPFFRSDATVPYAQPLRLRGREYDKGIGMHSYCKLAYELDGKYTRFVSDLGVDDSAAEEGNPRVGFGSVICRVFVDGKKAFDSGLVTGKDPVQRASVDLTGAKTLTLEVDFGGEDKMDILDRADWGNALLVKQ